MRSRGVGFARRRGWCQNARRGGDRYGHRPLCSEKKVLASAYFPTSYPAVSSAMEGLTSEFGMGSGVPPPPWTPAQISGHRPARLAIERRHIGRDRKM